MTQQEAGTVRTDVPSRLDRAGTRPRDPAVRRHVPESPRRLFTHGHDREADWLVAQIVRTIAPETGRDRPAPEREPIEIRQRRQALVPSTSPSATSSARA